MFKIKAFADRWVTINGAHILISEKGSVIKGPSHMIGTSIDTSNRKAKDFLPEDSFMNKESFKKVSSELKETRKQKKEIFDKYEAREKEIESKALKAFKKEYPEVDIDNRIAKILGEDMISEKNEYRDVLLSASSKEDELHQEMSRIKTEEGEKQLNSYFSEAHPITFTDEVDFEGFNVKTTGTPFGDEYLKKHPDHIAVMSPKEYLERSAYEIFGAPIESSIAVAEDNNLDEYAEMMKQGVKFDLPYLNYKDKGQEGRHRALAAYMAGIDEIPVLVMSDNVENIGSKKTILKDNVSPTTGERYPNSISTPAQRRMYTRLRNSGMSKRDAEMKVKNSQKTKIDFGEDDLKSMIDDIENEKLNLTGKEKDIFKLKR